MILILQASTKVHIISLIRVNLVQVKEKYQKKALMYRDQVLIKYFLNLHNDYHKYILITKRNQEY